MGATFDIQRTVSSCMSFSFGKIQYVHRLQRYQHNKLTTTFAIVITLIFGIAFYVFSVFVSDAFWLPFLSREIVHLQQKQIISQIYDKWWKKDAGIVCPEEDTSKVNNNALGVA